MKLLLITTLLITCTYSFTQQHSKFAFDIFPTGYSLTIQQPNIIKDNNSIKMTYGLMRIRTGSDYNIGKWCIYFDQHVYMNKAKSFMFQPMQAEWYTGVTYNINDKLKLKAEHLCVHPIKTSGKQDSNMVGGYDMLSISYNY